MCLLTEPKSLSEQMLCQFDSSTYQSLTFVIWMILRCECCPLQCSMLIHVYHVTDACGMVTSANKIITTWNPKTIIKPKFQSNQEYEITVDKDGRQTVGFSVGFCKNKFVNPSLSPRSDLLALPPAAENCLWLNPIINPLKLLISNRQFP